MPCDGSCGGCVGPSANDCSSCAAFYSYLKLDNGRVLLNDTAKGVCEGAPGALMVTSSKSSRLDA